MGKEIVPIYKQSQSQLSTSSLKAIVSLSPEYQTYSYIYLTKTPFPSATNKHQNNSILYSQNNIYNDSTITNNVDIQFCETQKKQNYNIPTISTPNHHSKCDK